MLGVDESICAAIAYVAAVDIDVNNEFGMTHDQFLHPYREANRRRVIERVQNSRSIRKASTSWFEELRELTKRADLPFEKVWELVEVIE